MRMTIWMRTSPIAIGWFRRRHGTHPGDDKGKHEGQFDPLVTVGAIVLRPNHKARVLAGPFLLRANCIDEQPEPEQHECAVKALHPPQRHKVPCRRFFDGVARSALVRVRVRVLDVGVPELALHEELLKCDLKDLARALAQPVVGRHRVTPGASPRITAADGARVEEGVASRVVVEASAANRRGQVRARYRIRACNIGGGEA